MPFGPRISDAVVADLVTTIVQLNMSWDDITAVIQLLNNRAFQVVGWVETGLLPTADHNGTYHLDGILHVADKPAARGVVSKLIPL